MPQEDLDGAVINSLNSFLNDENEWMKAVDLAGTSSKEIEHIKTRVTELSEQLTDPAYTREDAIRSLVEKITIAPGALSILVRGGPFSLNANPTITTVSIGLKYRFVPDGAV